MELQHVELEECVELEELECIELKELELEHVKLEEELEELESEELKSRELDSGELDSELERMKFKWELELEELESGDLESGVGGVGVRVREVVRVGVGGVGVGGVGFEGVGIGRVESLVNRLQRNSHARSESKSKKFRPQTFIPLCSTNNLQSERRGELALDQFDALNLAVPSNLS